MADRLFNPAMHPDFSSPSGNVMSAALAAARSTMSAPLPTHTQPPPALHNPQPALRHDLMMLSGGVNVSGAVASNPLPPVSHPTTTPLPNPNIPVPSITPPAMKQRLERQPASGVQKRVRKKSREPARFFCQVADCAKAFRMQGDLHAHMRIHTGEEPFLCSFPFCGRRYKWRSSLAHHEGLHVRKKGALLQRRPRRSKSRGPAIGQPDLQGQNPVGLRDAKEEFEL